jgi:hypothetical protein
MKCLQNEDLIVKNWKPFLCFLTFFIEDSKYTSLNMRQSDQVKIYIDCPLAVNRGTISYRCFITSSFLLFFYLI